MAKTMTVEVEPLAQMLTFAATFNDGPTPSELEAWRSARAPPSST